MPRLPLVRALAAAVCCGALALAQDPVALDTRIADAQRATTEGRLDIAHDLWVQVAALAPGDARVISGLERLQRIRSGIAAPDHLDERTVRDAARVAVEARRLLAVAKERATSQPEVARDLATDCLVLLRSSDPRGELAEVAGEAARALAAYQELTLATQAAARDAGTREQLGEAEARARTSAVSEQLRRESLLRRIQDLIEREHHALAAQRLREALVLYPDDAEFNALWRTALDRAHERRQLTLREREIEVRNEMMRRIEQDLIPTASDGFVAFADDWHERSRRRQAIMDEGVARFGAGMSTWEAALRDRLEQQVTVETDGEDAFAVLRSLSNANNLNLVVDAALVAGGEHPLTLKVRNMRLSHVLDWICRQAGCTWAVLDGGILVSKDIKESNVLTIHDASTLGIQYQDFPPFRVGLPTTGGAAGAAAPSLFGGGGGGAGGGGPQLSGVITPQEFQDLIKRVIEPAFWTANPEAAVSFDGRLMIVSAPPRIQRLVADFIRHQADLASLMVHSKVRWVQLADTDIERIGVSWHAPQTEYLTQPRAVGIYRESPHTLTDGTVLTENLPVMRDPLFNSPPGAGGPGLNLQWAHVGELETSAIFQAIRMQGQRREGDVIELTSLNGLQSTSVFVRQVAYIAGYNTTGGQWTPIIQTVNVGLALGLRPRVSADRKYVIADLEPAMADVTFFTVTINAVQSVPVGNGAVVFTAAFPIELPLVTFRQARTTVLVPDRATILVGGMTTAIEQRSESRVPLLSDIPFLGRLFSTRGRLSARERLYLLATFTILDMPEQESLQ